MRRGVGARCAVRAARGSPRSSASSRTCRSSRRRGCSRSAAAASRARSSASASGRARSASRRARATAGTPGRRGCPSAGPRDDRRRVRMVPAASGRRRSLNGSALSQARPAQSGSARACRAQPRRHRRGHARRSARSQACPRRARPPARSRSRSRSRRRASSPLSSSPKGSTWTAPPGIATAAIASPSPFGPDEREAREPPDLLGRRLVTGRGEPGGDRSPRRHVDLVAVAAQRGDRFDRPRRRPPRRRRRSAPARAPATARPPSSRRRSGMNDQISSVTKGIIGCSSLSTRSSTHSSGGGRAARGRRRRAAAA